MVDDPVGGVLRILASTVLAATLVGGVLYRHAVTSAAVRLGRLLRILPAEAPAPAGLPLERIVRDLRRLESEARRPREGTTHVRHRGVLAAYDDVLLEACRALGVTTSLGSLPDGLERESERLRVEFELEQAGIRIHTGP